MTKRYIDANALQAQLERKKAGIANQHYTEGWNDCMMRVKSMVSKAPTADVAPVVHGQWERRFCHPMRDGEWQYICSVCKNDNYWRNNVCHQKHRYCPNCGAKMDGVDNYDSV